MKYALFYESSPAGIAFAPQHFPAHRAHWDAFLAEKTLLAIGPFGDRSGALAIFTTGEAARAFAENDPFVLNGVVAKWNVREWNEVLLQPV